MINLRCCDIHPSRGQKAQGLKNERPGGETVPKDGDADTQGPYCVYFVTRSFQRPPVKK